MQKLIYASGGFVALLIIVGLALPQQHMVEVTLEIDAPPATVFALVNDPRRFNAWSPWADTDPNARFLYSGEPRGTGALMTWDGAIIGSGSQLISNSVPFERVDLLQNPGEPGQAKSWFQLTPGVGTTHVQWGFEADYGMNIVGRYFASMLGSIVARDYHAGLLRLKTLAERLPSADFSDIAIEHIIVESTQIAYLPSSSRADPTAMSEALGKAYFRVLRFIDDNNLTEAGAPLSILHTYSGAQVRFDAAIPVRGVDDSTPRESPGVRIGQTYAGPVVRVRHVGSYEGLTATHRKITAYLAALDIQRAGKPWESYVSDPGKVATADLLTYVYYPIQPK